MLRSSRRAPSSARPSENSSSNGHGYLPELDIAETNSSSSEELSGYDYVFNSHGTNTKQGSSAQPSANASANVSLDASPVQTSIPIPPSMSIHSTSSPPRWAASSNASTTLDEKFNPRSAATHSEYAPYPGVRHRPSASRDYVKNGKDLNETMVGSLQGHAHKAVFIDTNPDGWDTIGGGRVEDDDYLHDPEKALLKEPSIFSMRGVCNLGTLFIVIAGILTLFAGYPLISHFETQKTSTKGGYNLGGSNASGQVAQFPTFMRNDLVDADTPDSAKTRTGFDGLDYTLVFSDEFNTDGRSFYPGDDPFWEAVDLHYWATNNYEWYDPAAITTKDGQLSITLSQTPEHNLNFRGGMLQSWNKFCFTGGYIEASVQLPGTAGTSGLWPAFWTMGNLGRAGYGATLEGAWPYSYDECDVGTLQNQTTVAGLPVDSQTGGNSVFNRKHLTDALSFLGGQRMSACTCPADYPELHPGPLLPDGTLRGRGAPEIDIFEAQVNTNTDRIQVSQSAQWAPFNMNYTASNTTGPAYTLFQPTSKHNSYTGEITQQSASVVTDGDQEAIQVGGGNTYATYGFEYQPGTDGYVQWVSAGQPSWKLNSAFLEADPLAQIGTRQMAAEPMYIIFNLGISQNFATPNWEELAQYWPAVMKVDYVRVYQRSDSINVGCDPPDYPTADFISRHSEAYNNYNLTTWGGTTNAGGYAANWPRNNMNPDACSAPLSTSPGSPVTAKAKAPILRANQIGNNND